MTKARDISKLSAVEVNATADQTNAEVKAAAEAASDSNTFTDADHSKLNAIEASADVTDTANVTSSGALMDSELTNLAAVKAINQSLVTTAGPTFASVVVDNITIDGTQIDLSSGDLTIDVAGDIILDADGGDIYFKDDGTTFLQYKNGGTADIYSLISDKDLKIIVNDGGSNVDALVFDASAAGSATFSSNGTFAGNLTVSGTVLNLPTANSYITGAGHNVLQVDSTRTYFYGGTNGVQFRTADNASELVSISNAGNVGIGGTPATNTKLLVKVGTNQNFEVETASSKLRLSALNDARSANVPMQLTSSSFEFLTGNVGIGVAPATRFDVMATGANQWYIRNTNGSAQNNAITSLRAGGYSNIALDGEIVQFKTSGTERMRITDGGNVGIGVVPENSYAARPVVRIGSGLGLMCRASGNPSHTWINSNSYQDPSSADDKYIATDEASQILQANGAFNFNVAASGSANAAITWNTAMAILNNGNVGIGTTSPNSAADLHVADTSDARIWLEATNGDTLELYAGTNVSLFNRSNNALTFGTNNAERMRINSSGNVGIGTTSPSSKLEVSGAGAQYSKVANTSASTVAYIGVAGDNQTYIGSFAGASDTHKQVNIAVGTVKKLSIGANGNITQMEGDLQYAGGTNWDIKHAVSNQNITFHTNSSGTSAERMRITSAGKIGIGTSDPQEEVHVMTNGSSSIRASGQSNNNKKIEIGYDTSDGPYLRGGSSGIATLKFFVDNTSLSMTIAQNDVISGDFNDTSDVALKENITDLETATTKLKQLKPRTFDWKKANKENGVAGFIAQEVETIIPKAVVGTNYENSGDAGKAINTTAILAYAIKTIQELEARITALEA